MAEGHTKRKLIQNALIQCRNHQTEESERELYEQLNGLVTAMVVARAGDIQHYSRKIVADVFVVIFLKLEHFDESRSGEGWVCEIVKRTVHGAITG